MTKAIPIILTVTGLLSHPVACAADPKPSDEFGLTAGKTMPTHVADFVNDRGDHRCGCPSVMIANSGRRGVIVWSRGVSDPAFRLAKLLDAGIDNERFKRFLIAFDADDKVLKEKATGLSNVLVGKARQSAKEGLDRRGVDAKTQVHVFLLDKEHIASAWSFAADELSDAKVKELVAAARQFAAGDK